MEKFYHGSEKIIMTPNIAQGKLKNDYGQGFYMTKDFELAGEWACRRKNNGYINVYALDFRDLKILDLNDNKYNILHWLTILLQNRTFDIETDIAMDAKEYLVKNYCIDYGKYDLIIGYRADDSYFSFANDFIQNNISLKKLEYAFTLGDLGIQYVLKSKKAFESLKFINVIEAKADEYYMKFKSRDDNARKFYGKFKKVKIDNYKEIYVSDLLNDGEIYGKL